MVVPTVVELGEEVGEGVEELELEVESEEEELEESEVVVDRLVADLEGVAEEEESDGEELEDSDEVGEAEVVPGELEADVASSLDEEDSLVAEGVCADESVGDWPADPVGVSAGESEALEPESEVGGVAEPVAEAGVSGLAEALPCLFINLRARSSPGRWAWPSERPEIEPKNLVVKELREDRTEESPSTPRSWRGSAAAVEAARKQANRVNFEIRAILIYITNKNEIEAEQDPDKKERGLQIKQNQLKRAKL